jgi:hypothetical protein
MVSENNETKTLYCTSCRGTCLCCVRAEKPSKHSQFTSFGDWEANDWISYLLRPVFFASFPCQWNEPTIPGVLVRPTSNVEDNSRTLAVNGAAVSWFGATKCRRISLLFVELVPLTFTVFATFYIGLSFFHRRNIFCSFVYLCLMLDFESIA